MKYQENEFCNRLRIFAIKEYGSLNKLAEAINMQPQQLNFYVNDKLKPGFTVFERLAAVDCDLNWLFGKKNKKK